jgi:Ca2+-binding RTX toxin-like protein
MARAVGTNRGDIISAFDISDGVRGRPSLEDPNRIIGQAGDDFISGGLYRDKIFGGPGNDHIFNSFPWKREQDIVRGGPGDDFLVVNGSIFGGPGDDTLIGGDVEYSLSSDYLDGGPGNDVLDGLKGQDKLLGGAGDDIFRFAIGITGPSPSPTTRPGEGNRDVILDFGRGHDLIDLSGYQTFFNTTADPVFLGTAPFSDSNTGLQVRYDIVDGHTIVQFRSAVDEWWRFPIPGEIDLVGVFRLTAADFILS